MKILFLTDNFPPEVNAPATRTYEHCKAWVEKGADVTVITCAPNFPKGKVFPGYKNRLVQTECLDGIQVVRVWTYIAANRGFAKRVLDQFSFAVAAFFAGLFEKFDILVATSPQFFTTWAGWALSGLKRKPWVFELRDLWPETIKANGALEDGRVYRLLEKIELSLYRSAAAVVSVSPAFNRNLIDRGISESKLHVITNGVQLSEFVPTPRDQYLAGKLGLENKFVIGYIGTHGLSQNLLFIIESIRFIDNSEVAFLFVGDGEQKSLMKARAEQLGLENVHFIDTVGKTEIVQYWALLDVAMVCLANKEVFRTVIPSKIFEAVAMEKPVLLGGEGQSAVLVDKFEVGFTFAPENVSQFVDSVYEIVENRDCLGEKAKNCTEMAKQFDRVRLAGEMYEILRAIESNSIKTSG